MVIFYCDILPLFGKCRLDLTIIKLNSNAALTNLKINAGNGTQLLNNLALKVATLIAVKAGGEAIMTDEIVKQDSGSGFG